MNNQNIQLEQLFSQARVESPETTFELTKKQFLASLVLAAGGVLATKGILHLFTKKWIIMTTISLLTTVGVVTTAVYFSNTTAQEQPIEDASPQATTLVTTEDQTSVELPFQDVAVENETVYNDYVTPLQSSEMNQLKYRPYEGSSLLADYDDTLKDKDKDKNKEKVKIKAYGQRFEVNRRTKVADLDQIKKDAIAAGINFDYSVEYDKELITVFSMQMSLNNGSNSNMTQTITFDEDDDPDESWVVEWKTDEDGKATRIGASEDPDFDFENYMKDFEQGMKEFEVGMQAFEIEMAELENIRFDSPEDSVNYEDFMRSFSVFSDSFEMNLPSMDGFDFDFSELEESLSVLENLNEEILEELNIQMELLHKELEEMNKEIEKEREERGEKDEKDERDEEDERDERKEKNKKNKHD